MKNLILLLAGLLVVHPAIGQPTSTVTAFVNVNVVPMTTEHILLQQTVLVDGETIFLIGDVDTVPVP